MILLLISAILLVALIVSIWRCREWRIRCELAREELDAYRDDDSWQSLAKTLSEENLRLRDALDKKP
jgi:hypothetical protein